MAYNGVSVAPPLAGARRGGIVAAMFCKKKELLSESDVEQKLVLPILVTASPRGLAYSTEEIHTKHSIRRFEIDKGTAKKLYYPDYVVVLAGLPVLVVEVKSPDDDVEEGIREARLYASELNALYPTGTNPCLRVISVNGNRLLSSPVDTVAFDVDLSFERLTDIDIGYAGFLEKAGRAALHGRANAILQRQASPEYFRALKLLGGPSVQNEEIADNTFGADIASRFSHLFNPTNRDDRRFIAKYAYIPSLRRQQYVEPIDRVIRAAAPPSISASKPIENSASPSPMIAALKRVEKLHHQVMLLVGGVGAGKTTFVDYLQEVALSPDVRSKTEWIHVSLNEAPLDPAKIYDWVLDGITNEFKKIHDDMDFDALPAWNSVFSAELNRFRNTVLAVLPKDSPSVAERLADELQRLLGNRHAIVNAMMRYFCAERKKAAVLVLDNCDKRTLDEQLLMFQVAQWAKDTYRCLVFLPIRDVTYDIYRNRPPLDTALKDLVFHIEPPLFSKVLARRIALALDEMSKEDGRKKLKFLLKSGIEVEYPASDRAMYLVSISKTLFEYDRIVRRLITALAGRDVRKAMELFLEFCRSGHISENDIWRIKEAQGKHILDYDVVVRVLLRMNRRFYDGDKSYVHNLLQCDPKDMRPDHFVRISILRWLQVRFSLPGPTSVTGYHQCRSLIGSLIVHGHDIECIRREAQYLVRHGCIVTEHQDKDQLSDDDLISISPSGWVHVELLGNTDYLAACAEDTWFGNPDCAERIAGRIGKRGVYGHYHRTTITANARELVQYLAEQLQEWYQTPDKFLVGSADRYLHSLDQLLEAVLPPKVVSRVAPTRTTFGIDVAVGDEMDGRVTGIKDFGVFVRLLDNFDGLIHISRLPRTVDGAVSYPKHGQNVRVRVIHIDNDQKRVGLEWLSQDSATSGTDKGDAPTAPPSRE